MTILIRILLTLLIATSAQAATYTVPATTSTVDGDTYCGGSTCTSADTIVIRGGHRGNLLLQDFDGNGGYITITNESVTPDAPVDIQGDGTGIGTGVFSVSNCKYLDITGSGDPDVQYGILVNNGGTGRSGAIKVYGESDHIKISYTHITFDGNTAAEGTGSGIQVQDASLTNDWIFDTFEIHHNYIQDVGYAGMYLGHNHGQGEDDPYIANFLVHDNTMKDMGGYGLTLKGVWGTGVGYSEIYNNLVDTTGLVASLATFAKHGIGSQMHYNGSYAKVYGNTVMNTASNGLKFQVTGTGTDHQVYDNEILGCGTSGEEVDSSGIFLAYNDDADVYDNIIIQPNTYGIYVKDTKAGGVILAERNLIGDAGIGATYDAGTGLVEGTGEDANLYEADVSDFGFCEWSDDGNYYNDNFNLPPNCDDTGPGPGPGPGLASGASFLM